MAALRGSPASAHCAVPGGIAAAAAKMATGAVSGSGLGVPSAQAATSASIALQRSAVHLNGIPCFVFQAYRSAETKLAHPARLWADAAAALDATRSVASQADGSGVTRPDIPKSLFDALMVSHDQH